MRYLGFHFTYPGVGRIERDGEGYRFVSPDGETPAPCSGPRRRIGWGQTIQTGRP